MPLIRTPRRAVQPLKQDSSTSLDDNNSPPIYVSNLENDIEKQKKRFKVPFIILLILIFIKYFINIIRGYEFYSPLFVVLEELIPALITSIISYCVYYYGSSFFNTGKTFVSNTATNDNVANVTSDGRRPPKGTVGTEPPCVDPYNSFPEYFETMRLALITRINHASRQSELLMDQGIMMAYKGIGLYIFFVIVWQILPIYTEIKQQYYFGYASSTALFLFMEFLAAWSLKQYRNYVEISTYLLKVKSTLDRYILTYLVQKESSGTTADSKLLELLSKDLTWPDTFLNKHPDVSFAKECLETSTLLVRSLKGNAKDA